MYCRVCGDGKHDPDSDIYQCQLGARAISPVSRLVTDKDFESGVVKIERNQLRSMSSSERNASRSFLVSNYSTAIVSGSDSEEDGEKSIMAPITKKRRKLSNSTAKYIDSRFICGSVAKVERLWSLAKFMLQNHRKSMPPVLVEVLLFLKVKRAYWDISLVYEAMNNSPTERVADVLDD